MGFYAFSKSRTSILQKAKEELVLVESIKIHELERFLESELRSLSDANLPPELSIIIQENAEQSVNDSITVYIPEISISEKLRPEDIVYISSGTNVYKVEQQSSGEKILISKPGIDKLYEDISNFFSFGSNEMKPYISNDSVMLVLAIQKTDSLKNRTIYTRLISDKSIVSLMEQSNMRDSTIFDSSDPKRNKLGNFSDYLGNIHPKENLITKSRRYQPGLPSGVVNDSDKKNDSSLNTLEKTYLNTLNWIISIEKNQTETMDKIHTIRNDLIFIFLLTGMLMIGLSLVLAKTIVYPINQMKEAAIMVGEGDYGVKLPVINDDEIGTLTDTFNKMTRQIQEQTGQLIEREERLRHFYEATVDGIILHEDGTPVLVNKALSILTQFSESELMNLSLRKILKLKSDNNKSRVIYETYLYKKDGTEIPVEVQENIIEFQGRNIQACVIRDIQKRKQIETDLQIERSKKLSSLLDGQEMERQRLSRDLHDGLGQSLIALKLQLENKENQKIKGNTLDLKEEISGINNTIDEVRQICNNLRPPVLTELGLDNAIHHLCKIISQRSGISVEFDSSGDFSNLKKRTASYLYRIVQEAINNSLKHSSCSLIKILLHKGENFVMLIIEDNGKGYETSNISNGNGLYNMKERTSLLNGIFETTSSLGSGTIHTIKIPINDETPD